MTTPQHYDAIIIGAGQGGMPFAVELAHSGRRTALIEREHIGGTCINEGCTPTKTMVASARVAYLARRASDYGVHTGAVSVSMHDVRRRKGAIVRSFRGSNERKLANAGVDVIRGEGSFTGPRSLSVRFPDGSTRELSADLIIINTGARPALPPIPGLDDVPHLNSTTIMELDEVPEHLLVLGGGYVGLEFAQMFRRFGSEVTIVEPAPLVFGHEDRDIADEMAHIIREDGIQILTGTSAGQVTKEGDAISLSVHGPEGARALRGTHLLVATGRVPNTETLNLEAAGIETNSRGFVVVDDRLATGVPGVYAIGDVAGSPAFTHISYDDFRILRANLLEGGDRNRTDRLVPYVVFIDPQLGRVGMTETEARKAGKNILVGKIPMNYVSRALEVDESRGLVKVVVDADTGQILGCAVLGIEGGEIMAMMEIAMLGKLPYTVLQNAIFAHPTLAELLNTLFSSLEPAEESRAAA